MAAVLKIPSIVEGHGEVRALPVLLRRLLAEWSPQLVFELPNPIRVRRASFLNREGECERALQLAALYGGDPSSSFILLLFDADDDCPVETGPELLEKCASVRGDYPIGLTLAKREYEAWFLASAGSLRGKRSLPEDLERPDRPEEIRDAKGWIKTRRHDGVYSETLDQPAYSALFDFREARAHSPSFDKFCRDLESLLSRFEVR